MTTVLNPVTRKNFMQWHKENNLLLLGAGRGNIETTLEKLSDYGYDWRSHARQTTRACVETGDKIYMTSNGCDEFILVAGTVKDDGKQALTIYLVK